MLPPHVFAGVTSDMAIAQDEIFGPVAPIIKDEREALHVANQTKATVCRPAVFTQDRERGVNFSALRVGEPGMTRVNDHSVDDTPTESLSVARRTAGSGGSAGSGSYGNLHAITG